jgi:subtilisin family serine protease
MPTTPPTPKAVSAPRFEPDILLVMAAGGVDDANVQSAIKDAPATIVGTVADGPLKIYKIKSAPGKMALAESKLARDRNFLGVQRNYIYEEQKVNQKIVCVNDPFFPQQWNLGATNVPRAWNISKGAGTILGILDTGCKTQIAELSGKCYSGWDTVGHTPYQTDLHGHGTMVATTAAANTNNWINTASPARLSWVYPIRLGLQPGTITEANLLEGIYIAGRQGIKILNISYNLPPPYSLANRQVHPLLHTYLQWYQSFTGGLVFNASGNYGMYDSSPLVPYLQVVTAIDQNFELAGFSNYGNCVWFTCPGVNIFCSNKNNQVVSASGTSFAAPQVAAIAAMVWSANKWLTGTQVLNIIKQTAYKPQGQSWTPHYGFGLPNAHAAVQAASGKVVSN